MRIVALLLAGAAAFGCSALWSPAFAGSHGVHGREHRKHHVYRHRWRAQARAPFRGEAVSFWQKRYEEPQPNPYEPFGYGTAYAPD